METEITKKKREKHVYSKFEDLAHLFPHQEGKVASCRNGKLENNTIYSYHFPIARIYYKNKGKKNEQKIVFFTTRTYSSTTSQHIWAVRRACSHMTVLEMENVIERTENITADDSRHKNNMLAFVHPINNALEKFPKARDRKSTYLIEARNEARMLRKYMEFFGIKGKNVPTEVKKILKIVDSDKWDKEIQAFMEKEKIRLADPKLLEKREKTRISREKALEKKFAEQIQKWRNFEAYRPYTTERGHRYYCNSLPDLLRYNAEDKRIETSQGVQVPEESAHRFYRYIKAVIARGGCITTETCSYEIVGYTVKEITAEHIRIGCHRILMTEVESIASLLKWNENGK